MTFAKLSGMPSTTDNSSVNSAASSSGTKVNGDIPEAAQRDPQQHEDADDREAAGLDKGAQDRVAGFIEHHGRAGRIGLDGERGGDKAAQHLGVVGIALRQYLHAHLAVRRHPGAPQRLRQMSRS